MDAPAEKQARRELTRWEFALVLTTVVSAVLVAFVDRPVAQFFHGVMVHSTFLEKLNIGFNGVSAMVPLMLLFLIFAALWRLRRPVLPAWTTIPLLCSWTALLGVAAERILKPIFGRLVPGSYFRTPHEYEFQWMRGSVNEAFPSGTAMICCAMAAVLWTEAPRSRGLVVAGSAVLCIVIVVLVWHWTADVVAGAYIGALLGRTTVVLLTQKQ